MSEPKPHDTVKIAVPQKPPGAAPPPPYSSLIRIDVWGESHVGHVRPTNEDHFLIVRYGRFLETTQTNLPNDKIPGVSQEIGYGMLVADGMGGHAGGDVASQLVITTLVNLVLTTPDWILQLSEDVLVEEVVRRARSRVEQINRVLTAQAEADPRLSKLGSTMTAAWSLGKDLFVAHIGDSRAYVLRNQRLHQLTRDHTVAQEYGAKGIPMPSGLPVDRLRHVLTRALGAWKHDEIDITKFTLEDGDSLLLCSDGLTDMVSGDVTAQTLQTGSAEQACRQLVDLALEAGGKDNVTVIVARYTLPAA
jgi:protein phosphatase